MKLLHICAKNRLCSLLTLSSHQITCASNDYCLTGTCCAHAVFIFSHLFQLHMWTIITYIMFQLARPKKNDICAAYTWCRSIHTPYIHKCGKMKEEILGKKSSILHQITRHNFLRNQKEFAFSFEFLNDPAVLCTFWFSLNNKIWEKSARML